ncbi:MAG: hypothetical protein EOO62_17815 [Hymenobacter sp.]|nr:MAG: hypothetical protein EOO62_17815 [Hymenobacter sp.]
MPGISRNASTLLKLATGVGMFFLVLPYVVRLFSTPTVDVTQATAVAGEVTGSYMNRQYYVHYLNGDTKTYYDFNRFEPAAPPPPGLTQEEKNRRALGPYLRQGDYVTKTANAATLVVRRAGQTTQWTCATVD